MSAERRADPRYGHHRLLLRFLSCGPHHLLRGLYPLGGGSSGDVCDALPSGEMLRGPAPPFSGNSQRRTSVCDDIHFTFRFVGVAQRSSLIRQPFTSYLFSPRTTRPHRLVLPHFLYPNGRRQLRVSHRPPSVAIRSPVNTANIKTLPHDSHPLLPILIDGQLNAYKW
jgi:hypothetical protein